MIRMRNLVLAPFAVAISICAALFTTALWCELTSDDDE